MLRADHLIELLNVMDLQCFLDSFHPGLSCPVLFQLFVPSYLFIANIRTYRI